MKNIAKIFVLSAMVCISCKKEEEIPVSNKPIIPFTQLGNKAVQQNSMQQPVQQGAQTTTSTQQTAAPVQVAPGMNPSHGQPGHRCDIAVGAPLNSPKTTTTTTVQKPVVTQSKVIPAPAATPVAAPTGPLAPTPEGMNPPHGQEGHVCSVAVGAPLPK